MKIYIYIYKLFLYFPSIFLKQSREISNKRYTNKESNVYGVCALKLSSEDAFTVITASPVSEFDNSPMCLVSPATH